MNELKACPFCGGNAISSGIYTLSEDHPEYSGDNTRMVEIRCENCHIGVQYTTDWEYSETLLGQLIERWNKRMVVVRGELCELIPNE